MLSSNPQLRNLQLLRRPPNKVSNKLLSSLANKLKPVQLIHNNKLNSNNTTNSNTNKLLLPLNKACHTATLVMITHLKSLEASTEETNLHSGKEYKDICEKPFPLCLVNRV